MQNQKKILCFSQPEFRLQSDRKIVMLESAPTSHFSNYPDNDATDQHDIVVTDSHSFEESIGVKRSADFQK